MSNTLTQDEMQTVFEVTAAEPLVLPNELKIALGLEDGGTVTALKLYGTVVLTTQSLQSVYALDALGQAIRDANVTLDELLEGLDDVRSELLQEQYGISAYSKPKVVVDFCGAPCAPRAGARPAPTTG